MDLTTSYMGMRLDSPVVVASSGLTQSVEGVVRCAKAGAGAVVLKSIFEEQLEAEVTATSKASGEPSEYPEGLEYLERYGREEAFRRYTRLIKEAKEVVDIPVIASVHCVSAGAWINYAERMQLAGADALELNVFAIPSDPGREPREYEQIYFDIAREVQGKLNIPVALKIGSYFSGLAHTATRLSRHVDALVLFNRFYRVDFDIEAMKPVPAEMFSHPDDMVVPLRWIAILAERVDCDLAATTGVHDAAGVIKQLLAGAAVAQVCSALYWKRDPGYLRTILEEIAGWMERRGFSSIDEFRGKLAQRRRALAVHALHRGQGTRLEDGDVSQTPVSGTGHEFPRIHSDRLESCPVPETGVWETSPIPRFRRCSSSGPRRFPGPCASRRRPAAPPRAATYRRGRYRPPRARPPVAP